MATAGDSSCLDNLLWELDPIRVRLTARRVRQAMVAGLKPGIKQLFADYNNSQIIVERIQNDTSLIGHQREIALQITLAEAVKRRNAVRLRVTSP